MIFAFIDNSGQVMAVQSSPNAPAPTSWETVHGYTRVEVPDGVVATRDFKFVDGDFMPNDYARNRAAAYPSIGDQLDMQYHDGVDGTTTWADAIAAVKTKYPKP